MPQTKFFPQHIETQSYEKTTVSGISTFLTKNLFTFLVESLNFPCAFLSDGLVATAFASITSGVIPVKNKLYY